MDRETMLQHLAMAERHVAEGETLVAQQEARVAEMERDGHDSADARMILATIRQTQALHVQDRDRILKELEG